MSIPYASLFVAAGKKYHVDPALLAAMARAESGFNPNAMSPAGARGLMQIMPEVAANLGVNPMDPAQAIDGAARLMKQNLQRFGSTPLAVAAYNAGPGAVAQAGGIPPYAETQNYVQKVLQYQNEYEGAIGSGGAAAWVKEHPVVTVALIAAATGGAVYYFRPDLFRQIPVVGRLAAAEENPVKRLPGKRPASKAPGAGGGRVQTLLFPRSSFTPETAQTWAKKHGFKSGKVDVTDQYIRLRQLPPGGRMRTIQFQGTPIKAVVRFG